MEVMPSWAMILMIMATGQKIMKHEVCIAILRKSSLLNEWTQTDAAFIVTIISPNLQSRSICREHLKICVHTTGTR